MIALLVGIRLFLVRWSALVVFITHCTSSQCAKHISNKSFDLLWPLFFGRISSYMVQVDSVLQRAPKARRFQQCYQYLWYETPHSHLFTSGGNMTNNSK